MPRSLLAIAFVAVPLLLVGCYGPPPGPGTGDDEPTQPDAGPAGTADAGAAADPHDPTVFKDVVQPMLDSNDCSKGGCHGDGAGLFKLTANATGAALDANFVEVTKRNNLDDPTKSRVFVKGTTSHAGSKVFSTADQKKFTDWVAAAAAKP